MVSKEGSTFEKSPGEDRSLRRPPPKLTGISDLKVILWGVFMFVIALLMCAAQAGELWQVRYQNSLYERIHEERRHQAFSDILGSVDSSNPASYAVTLAQIQHLPEIGEYEKSTLLKLADSEDYFISKLAIHSLVEVGTTERLRLIQQFWKLCKMACDRGDYFKDREFAEIYKGVERYLEETLKDYVQYVSESKEGMPEEDQLHKGEETHDLLVGLILSSGEYLVESSNQLFERMGSVGTFIGREQAQLYVDSYKIFEVITYLTMVLKDETALSGVYSRYDPTTLNLHRALYRWVLGIHIFPDFYSGTERAMYNAVTCGRAESYKEIWNCLYLNNPLLQGRGISSILFNVNSRGLANNKREIRIIYDNKCSDPLSIMLLNLLNRHAGITAELRNVDEFIELIEYMQGFTHSGLEKIHLLNLIMFITFDRGVLDEINTDLQKFDDIWDEIKENTNLISFLPLEEKSKYDPKKLILPPKQIAWYDPKNPFATESDVFEISKKEFELFVLGKGKWSTDY